MKGLEKYFGVPLTDFGRSFSTTITHAVTSVNKLSAEHVAALDKAWYMWLYGASKPEVFTYLKTLETTKAGDTPLGRFDKSIFKQELVDAGIKPSQADWMVDQAQMHRDLMNKIWKDDKTHGSKEEYIKNYVSHIFGDKKVDGQTPSEFIEARIKSLGETWYQKERVFDTIEAAEKAGFKMAFDNPIDLVTARLAASVNSNMTVAALRQLQKDGLAYPVKDAPKAYKEGEYAWKSKYRTPDHQEWIIHPDGPNIFHNALVAKGIASRGDMLGSAYRGWMKLKNVWMPLQLAFSAFHELHIVGNIHPAENISRAIKLSMNNGEWGKNFLQAGKWTMQDALFGLPLDKIGWGFGKMLDNYSGQGFSKFAGREVMNWWDTPASKQTPDQKMWSELFGMGGVSPTQTAEDIIGAKRAWAKASAEGDYLRMVPTGMRLAIEKLQEPMFKYQIPALKNVSFMRDVAAAIKMDPSLTNDHAKLKVAVQEIGKNINDRYGEMFYKGLFWNRYLKDVGIGSMRSISWNLGQFRQAGGAVQNLLTK